MNKLTVILKKNFRLNNLKSKKKITVNLSVYEGLYVTPTQGQDPTNSIDNTPIMASNFQTHTLIIQSVVDN